MIHYLWGVASVLMLESIVLIFAIEWLRKKVGRYEKTG